MPEVLCRGMALACWVTSDKPYPFSGPLENEGADSLLLWSLLALKFCNIVKGLQVTFLPDSGGKCRPHPRKVPG